jgi:cell division protease FtsH
MGHALVALSCPTADPVHRVSIIPRGAAALGMTMQRPLEDRYLLTQPELEDRLVILLGGRAAEELVFGPVSTGAQNDLERATEIARAMVVEYGMSEKLGPLSFGRNGFRSPEGRVLFPGERPEMSEATAELVDQEIARLVGEAHERATRILREKRELLERLSRLLMAREVIEGKDLRDYVEGRAEIPEPEPVGAGRTGEAASEAGSDASTSEPATAPVREQPATALAPSEAPERAETLPLPATPPRPDPPVPPRPDRADDGG